MLHPAVALPQGAEWLIILAIAVFVFGAAKLPELARGTGQALRIFKAETKGLREDGAPSSPSPDDLRSGLADGEIGARSRDGSV